MNASFHHQHCGLQSEQTTPRPAGGWASVSFGRKLPRYIHLELAPCCIKVESTDPEVGLRGKIVKTVFLALCATLPATGQATQRAARNSASGPVFDATGMGRPVVLDKDWRVGVTADPAAAQPGFDDSAWPVRNAGQVIPDTEDEPGAREEQQDSGTSSNDSGGVHVHVGLPADRNHRFAWFRLHIRLAADHGPEALLIELPVTRGSTLGAGSTEPSVNVYANGQRVAAEGSNDENTESYQEVSRIYKLNVPANQSDLVLVVRTLYIPLGYGAYTNFFVDRTLRLGDPDDLERYIQIWNNGNLFERLPRLVYSVLLVVLAGFLLALYFAQKGHNEYLWLALHELTMAPVGFIELAGTSGRLEVLWYAALMLQLVLISAYLFFEFLVSFLALRRRWYIRFLRYTAPILACAGPTMLMIGNGALVGVALVIVLLGCMLWMAGWFVFTFVTLIAATIRRNFEAGLLLIPLVLSIIGSGESALSSGMSNFMGRPYRSPLTIMAGPIPIHFATIADFAGVLAIAIIILGRFLRIQREQQHATSELAAAKSVQELMIPQEKVATPGFEVVSVYNPAAEVGGDFFHVQTMGDGGVLIVIGDVAGKGLKAAMNVSMIMGALRRAAEQSPARILEALNRVLVGSESFTTCQAAYFAGSGELVLANAGHLPPYLNSQELAVPGGLPLGVVPDLTYEEIRLYVHPGDRILFLSDGVVEARRPSGELFGFERVHTLTHQPANFIADAAKSFGQVDDITVLTVRRLAHAEAARSGSAGTATLTTAAAS
jgi:phosphoserine phosphatase RsbU/P